MKSDDWCVQFSVLLCYGQIAEYTTGEGDQFEECMELIHEIIKSSPNNSLKFAALHSLGLIVESIGDLLVEKFDDKFIKTLMELLDSKVNFCH